MLGPEYSRRTDYDTVLWLLMPWLLVWPDHQQLWYLLYMLTHWGRVMHICVGNLTIIGSDNGLLPSGRQAIIWTNAGILLIEPLRTNFSEILTEIQTFSFKKMHVKISSAKKAAILSQPQCVKRVIVVHEGRFYLSASCPGCEMIENVFNCIFKFPQIN